jgi:hypothetical protein
MTFENPPRRLCSRQRSNRTAPRYAKSGSDSRRPAGTSFLCFDVVFLLEDHLIKLVPIVEIV